MRHDTDNELFTDAIQVMFVELSKLKEVLRKPVDEMSDLEKWAVFFRYAENPDYRDVVNRVIESKEALNVAGELLKGISQDERERAVFRSRRMYQSDMESNWLTARDVGRAERDTEIAKKLLSADFTLDTIIFATGLTRTEVEALRDAK